MAILWLGDEACHDVQTVGGKAANLSRLASGYRVPAGFCITPDLYHQWLSSRGSETALPQELHDIVAHEYQEMTARSGIADPAVAVRSSALDEDGAGASFAGQYDPIAFAGQDVSIATLLAGLALVGLGLGLATPGLQTSAVEAVDSHETGSAAGRYSTNRYLGSIIGLAIAIPLALFQPDGGVTTLVLTLVVFVVVQQIEGWFLTPKIMGDRTGLHFMAIIVAIFFWGTALGGILGMILAIPLTAFLASLWRLARQKYIAEIL